MLTIWAKHVLKKAVCEMFGEIETWGQFHQHFTGSFYTFRSQMQKKDSQVISVFLHFLGPTSVKAARKLLVKLKPDFVRRIPECSSVR